MKKGHPIKTPEQKESGSASVSSDSEKCRKESTAALLLENKCEIT